MKQGIELAPSASGYMQQWIVSMAPSVFEGIKEYESKHTVSNTLAMQTDLGGELVLVGRANLLLGLHSSRESIDRRTKRMDGVLVLLDDLGVKYLYAKIPEYIQYWRDLIGKPHTPGSIPMQYTSWGEGSKLRSLIRNTEALRITLAPNKRPLPT